MYLNEYDSNFPHPYMWLYNFNDGTFDRECAWHDIRNDYDINPQNAGILWPYLASKKMHVCPKFKRIASTYGIDHPNHDKSISSLISFK